MLRVFVWKNTFCILSACCILFFGEILSVSSFSPAFAQTYRTDSTATTNIGNPSTSGVGPTKNDCGGKYATDTKNDIFGLNNFGDPSCDFTQDKLIALLKQTDPTYWDRWYSVIVPGESAYDPNAEQLIDPVNSGHAWGLYQMSRKGFESKAYPQFDRGDVDWRAQTSNAIGANGYLNTHGGTCADGIYHNPETWCYWGTARQWWGQPL